jgi:hypothetical protein
MFDYGLAGLLVGEHGVGSAFLLTLQFCEHGVKQCCAPTMSLVHFARFWGWGKMYRWRGEGARF